MRNHNKRGFTLLELMIVIVIMGVLASLISGNFITSLKKGRDAKRKADLEQIAKALEMYYEDKKTYPSSFFNASSDRLCESTTCTSEKVYMQKVPTDPTKNPPYFFTINEQSFRLYACLENSEQILPYNTLSENPGNGWCNRTCYNQSNNAKIPCIYVLTDSSSNPY